MSSRKLNKGMADSNASMAPEGSVQNSRPHDGLRAAIRQGADIIRDMKQRIESRLEQDEQDCQNLVSYSVDGSGKNCLGPNERTNPESRMSV